MGTRGDAVLVFLFLQIDGNGGTDIAPPFPWKRSHIIK